MTTDYTDPATIDVGEVMANIDLAYRVHGHMWTDDLRWPNVTVKALADEVRRLRDDYDSMSEVAREWEAEAEHRRDLVVRWETFHEARHADWIAQKQTYQARVTERDAARAVIRRLVRDTLPLHEHEWSPAESAEIRHAIEDPT